MSDGDLPPSSRVTRLRLLSKVSLECFYHPNLDAWHGGRRDVPFSSELLDLFPGERRSREGNLVDVHMAGERSANFTITSDDADNTRWEASLFYELPKLQQSNRALLRTFVDEGTSSS